MVCGAREIDVRAAKPILSPYKWNKNRIELKVFFLEIVYPDVPSGKVWGFSIFSFCIPPGGIFGRLLLIISAFRIFLVHLFPCLEIKFSFNMKLLLNMMFTLWITRVTLITFLLTHVNKSLWKEKQYHFFVELSKTKCFHRLKIFHLGTNRVMWRCLYVPRKYISFSLSLSD